MNLIPIVPEDDQKDKDLEKARVLIDYIALNEEDGWTLNEIIKNLKGISRHTQFIYLLILAKRHILTEDEYPFASYAENGNVLWAKVVNNPTFKELPEGLYEELMADPSASFINKDPHYRLEVSLLAHCCRYISDTGFEGSIRYMCSNYNLQDLLMPFRYKELWDAQPRADLCTNIKLFDEEERVPNAIIEQIKSGECRKNFKAILAASSQSTITEKIKLMESLDKVDGLTQKDGNTTNIQNNIAITDTDLANRLLRHVQESMDGS